MQILESIFYGIISGLTEFLPISSTGHQGLLKTFFGVQNAPLLDLFVHIGLLLAVFVSCGTYIERLKRQLHIQSSTRSGRARTMDRSAVYDNQLIRIALVPMILSMILFSLLAKPGVSLIWLAVFFTINGIIVYVPEHLPHGNKDASQMSKLDSIMIGIFGALSVFPGVSRIGASASYAIGRGGDKTKVINWVLVLSLPALLFSILLDLISMFTVGIGSFSFTIVLGYLFAAGFAFATGIFGISLVRFFTAKLGFSSLGFYSWGAALLSLILYLTA